MTKELVHVSTTAFRRPNPNQREQESLIGVVVNQLGKNLWGIHSKSLIQVW